ncbi:hypothetical protein [Pseudomonas tussilaginis]|uniref:hypothetical protein n=1 Tax=Pseudomonas sp. 5 TaxID=1619949 RepID=UPI0005EAE73B|nr:hypothetical protein [Pseudomonas sp. 5]KJK06547.1 hypothetical protein UB47_15685 [Pseudomonas sp. 5]
MTAEQIAYISLALCLLQTVISLLNLSTENKNWLKNTAYRTWVIASIGVLGFKFAKDLYELLLIEGPITATDFFKANGYLLGVVFYILLAVGMCLYWRHLDKTPAV